MKSSAKKIELASVDDLFSTEEGRQDAKLEKIQEIPLSELHPFRNHPFKVKDDEAMMETADSIKQYGVLVPAIARPDPEGGYELVAGHRRRRASELAEKETMPVIIRDLDDDAATIIMVDSNLQRESLLPSERAFAYKMKLEAVKHQGARTDLTSRQVGEKSQTSIQKVADQAGESQRQVQRYIRLTELIPELMDMVDEKKIALNPAYELSFLKKEEQVDLLDAMDSEQATPSLSQAQRLKKYSQEGHLTLDMMRVIMGEEKKSDLDRVTFTSDTLRNEKQTKEFLQDIISDVSHQLKTPLSALKMYNEIIGKSDTEQAAVMDFSQKSLREIKRIEDVVYTLLKLARLDAGIIQMQKAPENISVLMQDILERFELWADRENKTITLSGDANITFHCDALWVSEAVGNIVKNALEHTAEGGHITVRWEQTPLLTQIVVEDNGKGIHPEDLYNIFKRFYRSRFSQDVHGIGLGLPLAKTIVESHGGTISVTSKIDVGTTFTLNFFNLTNE